MGRRDDLRVRVCGPLHLATDAAHDLDLVLCNSGATKEAAKLSDDALRVLRIGKSDLGERLFEVAHEAIHLRLCSGKRCTLFRRFDLQGEIAQQNGDSLGEVQYREGRGGGNSNDQVGAVQVVTA